jgi:catechol 2,3-dioxygenase-like lactoylglutathione lyase family enzyme
MAARLHALTVLASDPARLASFWGELLGWERSGLELLPDADAPMRLTFEHADLPHDLLNQLHFHLTSYTASQEDNVERALSLGATHLDVGQLPEEDHVVLADPEGNEFCILRSAAEVEAARAGG